MGLERQACMEKDLVCRMDVDPKKAKEKFEYKGKTYYFDSKGCKEDFEKDPEKYIKLEKSEQPKKW